MPEKDYQGYLATIGERLKQDAKELKAEVSLKDSFQIGILWGYIKTLDTMLDYLEMFNLNPEDLDWKDFKPERDLWKSGFKKRQR